MKDDTTITLFHQPGSILDPLTEIVREGARQILAAALKAENANFVAQFYDDLLPDGRQRVVRHGTGPERLIQTGIWSNSGSTSATDGCTSWARASNSVATVSGGIAYELGGLSGAPCV